MKYRVWCLSWDDTEDDACSVERGQVGEYLNTSQRIVSWNVIVASDAAEHYAEFCHDQRDGWEATWPLKFRVRSEDGTVQDFEVDREMAAVFSAQAVKS